MKLTKAAAKQLDREYAIEQLLTHYVKPGDTIHTLVRSVSSSGMSRTISLKIVRDGRIDDITFSAAAALEWPLVEVNGSRAIRVSGAGMDMGFHTVYTLSRVLFRPAVAGTDKDPGYLLEQRWI
jgi:hypothetical protein